MRWLLVLTMVSVGLCYGQVHKGDDCGGCAGPPSVAAKPALLGQKAKDGSLVVLANGSLLWNGTKDGATVRTADLTKKGKVRSVVLNFVGATCPFSQQQLKGVAMALNNNGKAGLTPLPLKTANNHQGVLVLTVFTDKDVQVVRKALREQKIPTPILWDKSREVTKAFKVTTTPTVVVLNKENKVIGVYEGMMPPIPEMYSGFFNAILTSVSKGTALPPQPRMGIMGGA